MQPSGFLVLSFSVLLLATGAPATADQASDEQLAADVRDAIGRFQQKDSTFEARLEKLVGYAVFPEVTKGGLVVGGAQKYAEIILFKTKSALNRFEKNGLELSAQATANAADQGAAAKAKYADGVAIFILPTAGLMVEASVGGQKPEFSPLKK